MYFTPNNNPWCTNCSLHKQRDSKVKAVHTHAHTPFSNILLFVLASYPGAREEKEGLSLVGESGKAFDKAINEVTKDIILPKCYRPILKYMAKGNVIRCNPKKETKISKIQMNACKNWLGKDLNAMHPKVPILACGSEAKKVLFGEEGSLYKMRGQVHYFESHPVVITSNPVILVKYKQETMDINGDRIEKDIITGSPKYFFMKDLKLMADVISDYVHSVILDGEE
jgi:uracil-DNA glycosylase family 4